MDTPQRDRKGLSTLAMAIVFALMQNQLLAQDDFVYWPRLDFVIPFQIDSNGQLPQEVILEVSEDGGGLGKYVRVVIPVHASFITKLPKKVHSNSA